MAIDPVCGMKVNESKGLKLENKGKDYFFCSRHCLDKFIRENKISKEDITACLVDPSLPFYKNKTFIVFSVLAGLVLLSYLFPFLVPLRNSLVAYFKVIWWAILLGIFLGGIIDYYVPREYISHILAKPRKKTILYAVTLGFLMSACSHGILALAIQLHKKGASNPAVVSFLLASPWANITLTIMLIGFFGVKAFFIIIAAVVIAVITGFIFQFLEGKGLIEKNDNVTAVDKDFSIINDVKERWRKYRFSFDTLKRDAKGVFVGMIALSNMVLWWVLIGMGLASIAGAYIPAGIFRSYMGPSVAGIFITLLVATVIEVCSEGSAPMAFELFKQTGAFGNSFVFLMAGVVTDYTEIGLLWHNVGKRTAIWLPIITVPQVVLLGIIANILF
ncbi:MAG: permease [Candidatus Omnitrophota bacterium]